MNKRSVSPASERRSSSWRLATATLLATAAWMLFLSQSRWLVSSSEPVARRNEPLDVRLVELPQAQSQSQSPSQSQQNAAPKSASPKPKEPTARPVAKPTHVAPRRPDVARTPAPTTEPQPRTSETAQQTPPSQPTAPQRPADTADTRPNASATSPSTEQSTTGHSETPASGPARLVSQPLPELPDDLREEGYQFVAVARFIIHADGSFDVALVKPTPNPRLNQILMATLHKWRFAPATEAGHPVESHQDVRVHFNVN